MAFGDINDVQSLLEAMKGCQHVIHAAAMISFFTQKASTDDGDQYPGYCQYDQCCA